MIDLYEFQQQAADCIAQRVVEYISAPATRGAGKKRRPIPFVQFLSSITASGKTIILADTVAQIAARLAIKPAVLWLSKMTVVVEQSFAALDVGGGYHDLIDEFEVRALADLDAVDLRSIESPFLFFATVGKFNTRDKEGRKVYASQVDAADESIWEMLRRRASNDGMRRPLIVVYDEAHNLSDQQTDILLKLDPDCFLLSTATSRVPRLLKTEVVDQLYRNDFADEDLIYAVPPSEVAASELIKAKVALVGRRAPMEDVISEMYEDLVAATDDAAKYNLPGQPKAVYVCRTNIVEGDASRRDDPRQPFTQRQAPPILIWRHLVERLQVDPSEIAVYCDLKVDKSYPLPDDFVLFRGGEKDYDDFVSGDFKHIIFNLALQEGWDDPLVYFAYIDKTLGSTIAAEQIVGRILRQPGRRHYPSDRLNSAQVHIRVESDRVFSDVVSETQKRLRDDMMPVSVVSTGPGKRHLTPLPPRELKTVPEIAEHFDEAIDELEQIVQNVPDYRDDHVNTKGAGYRTQLERVVGSVDDAEFEWIKVGLSANVLARWVFGRALRRLHPRAAAAITLSDPKWDAPVGVDSPAAASLEQWARSAGEVFVDESYIEVAAEDDDDYQVPAYLARDQIEKFTNALHEGYDGLNPSLELPFARELDRLGLRWARNPSQSGYWIPIVRLGDRRKFYPDFLVWGTDGIFAIDTKGSHLEQDMRDKLVRLAQAEGRPKVHLRFVIEGQFSSDGKRTGIEGYTVVGFRPDHTIKYLRVADLASAAVKATSPTL